MADRTGGALRAFGWSLLSVATNRLVAFVATLLLARLLGPTEFGVAAAALVLVAFLDVVLDFGVSAAVIYEQEQGHSERLHTAFTVNQLAAALLTLVALLTSPFLATFLQVPGRAEVFQTLSLVLLLRSAGQIHDALLKRELNFRRRMAADVARAAMRAAVSIGLALSGYGVWSIVWGYLAAELTGTVFLWLLVPFRPRLRLQRDVARQLLGFGGAFSLLRLVNAVWANADLLVVGSILGPALLGIYSIAYRVPTLVVANVLFIFSTVAFPVYTRARDAGPDVLRSAMTRALRLTTLFGFTTGTGLAIVSRDAVAVAFGAEWAAAAAPMAVLAVALGISAVGFASGDIFPAIGRPGLLLALNVPSTVLLILAAVLGARWGVLGVAVAQLVVLTVYSAARLLVARHLVGGRLVDQLVAMWPGVAAALGVCALALPIRFSLAPGPMALGLTVAAGALGAFLALALTAREALHEVLALGNRLRGSGPAPDAGGDAPS